MKKVSSETFILEDSLGPFLPGARLWRFELWWENDLKILTKFLIKLSRVSLILICEIFRANYVWGGGTI